MSKNILWVEDDPDQLEAIVRQLKLDGHNITTALNIRQAETYLREKTFDLILLDLVISKGDNGGARPKGYSQYQGLGGLLFAEKFLKNRSATPLVILSIYSEDTSMIKRLKKSGIKYVCQKSDSKQLIEICNIIFSGN